MNTEEYLEKIMNCSKNLANKCIAFANEQDEDTPNTRFFRLFTGYMLAIDTLTTGIKNASSAFMEAVNESPEDIRRKNL